MTVHFDNSYAQLPQRFYTLQAPVPVKAPTLIRLNAELADELGLDASWLASPDGVAMLAGNRFPETARPLSMAYAGHQFGNFVPQLGDGRALLIGEVVDRNGRRRDIQLKGSGPTPWSRRGDGRAALGPVLREYIVSEAMAALGVPTTRALAAVTTGEHVLREDRLPGGVLTRVAGSHIRVGTFQYFYARGDVEALRTLADHVIDRHDPAARQTDNPYAAMLAAVIERQAQLIAAWLGIGFIHGVMNTDNTTLSGETIDYGPCAFMDAYDPGAVYSSIDQFGRYAYGNQPQIGQWNLANLAQSLVPLLADEEAAAVEVAKGLLDAYPDAFETAYETILRAKLGLAERQPGDLALAKALLALMAEDGADFTNAFRALSALSAAPTGADEGFVAHFSNADAARSWLDDWRARLGGEGRGDADRIVAMKASNPAIIPRNHRVEEAISDAYDGRLGTFGALVDELANPFADRGPDDPLVSPPEPHQVVHRTFCGT
ncbi:MULTISPECIES: protein adenylyltransferase SelO [unclassified Roseitalea]|uniref:protein adenylyltransferase SelO n=1 Tax=unclassified Roseitalea TaxID=2639107 RepID=UPI00273E19AC|nr:MULTISPECIES: YdiU family protein [unclassified Roseitalea]